MRALWEKVKEPRVVHVMQFLVYATTLTVGIITIMNPPTSIEGAVGEGLTIVWALFLILGGALGAVTVLPGIWWLERVAVLSCGTGVVIYGAIVLTLHLSEAGNRLPQAGFIAIVLLSFAKRGVSISRYAHDPEK